MKNTRTLLLLSLLLVLWPAASAQALTTRYNTPLTTYSVSTPDIALSPGTDGTAYYVSTNKTWAQMNVTAASSNYYVNSTSSDVDSNGEIGTHSNFTAQQCGPDGTYDILTEADSPAISANVENFVDSNTSNVDGQAGHGYSNNFTAQQDANIAFNDTLTEADTNGSQQEALVYMVNNQNPGSWTNPTQAYNNNTGDYAQKSVTGIGWTGYLILNCSGTVKGTIIRYWVSRSSVMTTMTINIANQTGAWINVYNATPTWGSYQNSSFSYSTYTAVEFQFRKPSGTGTQSARVNEVQAVNASINPNYELDYEFQWTTANFTENNSYLCIRTDTFAGTAENLGVDCWNTTTSTWQSVTNALTASQWNNYSISTWLTSATITFRFIGKTESGDTAQNTWKIECTLLHTWNSTTNYRLDMEEQWTNVDYSKANEQLSIYCGTMGTENLTVDVWAGSSWQNIFASLAPGWNNVSISSFLNSSTFTTRFIGSNETNDSVQDSWQIDAALIHVWTDYLQNVLNITNQNVTTAYQVKLEIASITGIGSLSNFTGYLHDGTISKQVEILNGVITHSSGSLYTLATSSSIYISLAVDWNASASCTANLKLHVVKNGTVSPEFIQTIIVNAN